MFVCGQCGYETARWMGKCPECGSWNSFTEEVREAEKQTVEKKLKRAPGIGAEALLVDNSPDEAMERLSTGRCCRAQQGIRRCGSVRSIG